MLQFLGIDILATILVILEYYYIGKKKKIGFIYGVLSCILWIGIAVYTQIWMLLVMNVFIGYAITKAYLKWGKEDEES